MKFFLKLKVATKGINKLINGFPIIRGWGSEICLKLYKKCYIHNIFTINLSDRLLFIFVIISG